MQAYDGHHSGSSRLYIVSTVRIDHIGIFIFQGIDAEYVSLEDIVPITDDGDLHAQGPLDQTFYDSVAAAVGERIKACAPRVPVVTGTYPSPSCTSHTNSV